MLGTHSEVWYLRTSARPHQDCSGTRSPVSLSSDCSCTPTSCGRVGVFPPLPAGEGRAPPWPETTPPTLTCLWMFWKGIWVIYDVGTGREGGKEVAGIGVGPLLSRSLFCVFPMLSSLKDRPENLARVRLTQNSCVPASEIRSALGAVSSTGFCRHQLMLKQEEQVAATRS